MVTYVGDGRVSMGHPRPYFKGLISSAPQFWGFFSICVYILRRRTTKFNVVTHGEGLVLGQPPTIPKGGASALPNFGVLLYLCLHLLT